MLSYTNRVIIVGGGGGLKFDNMMARYPNPFMIKRLAPTPLHVLFTNSTQSNF
jgi:hypothetical protein